MKKAFKWIIVTCVLLFFVIFFLILLPPANKKKNVDKILDKIEFFIDNDKLDSVDVYSNRLHNRQLTDKQQKRYDVLVRERKREKQAKIEAQEREEREAWERKQEEEFVLKGWYFLRDNYLKAPSTASLNGYIITDDGDLVLEYDAQNGFGAMIRSRAFVSFENGEPKVAVGM